jgi:hypothetical protein
MNPSKSAGKADVARKVIETYQIEPHAIEANPIEANPIEANEIEANVIEPPAPQSQEGERS